MVRVEIDGMERVFDDGTRIGPIDLVIEDGEALCLLGPSGSGKTTTLRMVAGFIKPQRGRLTFDDADVTEVPPRQRGIGMVFQSVALFPNMDVFRNIAFGPGVAGWDHPRVVDRVVELADMLEIRQLLRRRVRDVSGGEAQRVALARALANEPRLLLLDEPLSSLDPQLRDKLQYEIRRVQKKLRTTMIYVTHSQSEAFAVADRIAVLKDGVVSQAGTPEELYNSPANSFIAGFIGAGNTFVARVESELDGYSTVSFSGKDFRVMGSSKKGTLVSVMVRPQDVEVSLSPMEDSFAASVQSVTPQLGSHKITVECDGTQLTAWVPDTKLADTIGKQENAAVRVRFRPDSGRILG